MDFGVSTLTEIIYYPDTVVPEERNNSYSSVIKLVVCLPLNNIEPLVLSEKPSCFRGRLYLVLLGR